MKREKFRYSRKYGLQYIYSCTGLWSHHGRHSSKASLFSYNFLQSRFWSKSFYRVVCIAKYCFKTWRRPWTLNVNGSKGILITFDPCTIGIYKRRLRANPGSFCTSCIGSILTTEYGDVILVILITINFGTGILANSNKIDIS